MTKKIRLQKWKRETLRHEEGEREEGFLSVGLGPVDAGCCSLVSREERAHEQDEEEEEEGMVVCERFSRIVSIVTGKRNSKKRQKK